RRLCGIELQAGPFATRLFGEQDAVAILWTRPADERSGRARWVRTDVEIIETPTVSRRVFDRIVLPGPGRYRISFPEFPALATLDVDVPIGEFVKCVVGN